MLQNSLWAAEILAEKRTQFSAALYNLSFLWQIILSGRCDLKGQKKKWHTWSVNQHLRVCVWVFAATRKHTLLAYKIMGLILRRDECGRRPSLWHTSIPGAAGVATRKLVQSWQKQRRHGINAVKSISFYCSRCLLSRDGWALSLLRRVGRRRRIPSNTLNASINFVRRAPS
jgi:hypothetical protein